MAKQSPYRGRLMPGAAKQLARSLREYRKAAALGLNVKVQVLGCPDCHVSQQIEKHMYSLDDVPTLPLDGCDRTPCCGCCYTADIAEQQVARRPSGGFWRRWFGL
jgi:hypothetical protein